MRFDPLNIVLNTKIKLEKKFYFISGNEISLIEKVKSTVVNNYKSNDRVAIININEIGDYRNETGFFENKKIILVKNHKGISEESLKYLHLTNDVFIFVQENSQKIKKIKNIFIKDNDSYLIDCYELDRKSKLKVLNHFLDTTGHKLGEDLYWFLVDKLDNKYVLLESVLNKICELDKSEINPTNIRKILTIDDTGKEKIFFSLLKKNREIIRVYREKILTSSDVNEFYFSCKYFCQLIIEAKNLDEYNKKIPLYLFREKNFLANVYKNYNAKKKKSLLRLLSSTEKTLRKESGLSLVFGLRFFLNIKKITIS